MNSGINSLCFSADYSLPLFILSFPDHVRYLADAVEANRPITKDPTAPPVDPSSIKTYEDKVPDPDSFDLESILD